jgi:hypothetical protein
MSTQLIDPAARQDARQLLNAALLRMLGTVALSVVFALIDCATAVDSGPNVVSTIVSDTPPAVSQTSATAPADSFDHRVDADAHARRN